MIVFDKLWETMKEKNISQYKLIKAYALELSELIICGTRKKLIPKLITLNSICAKKLIASCFFGPIIHLPYSCFNSIIFIIYY